MHRSCRSPSAGRRSPIRRWRRSLPRREAPPRLTAASNPATIGSRTSCSRAYRWPRSRPESGNKSAGSPCARRSRCPNTARPKILARRCAWTSRLPLRGWPTHGHGQRGHLDGPSKQWPRHDINFDEKIGMSDAGCSLWRGAGKSPAAYGACKHSNVVLMGPLLGHQLVTMYRMASRSAACDTLSLTVAPSASPKRMCDLAYSTTSRKSPLMMQGRPGSTPPTARGLDRTWLS